MKTAHLTASNLRTALCCPASVQTSGWGIYSPAEEENWTEYGTRAAEIARILIETYDTAWKGNISKIEGFTGQDAVIARSIASYAYQCKMILRDMQKEADHITWGTEKTIDLGGILGEGITGRADFVAISQTTAAIADLKAGNGRYVYAYGESNPLGGINEQLAIYALRIAEISKIDRYILLISQPRLGNHTRIELTRGDLMAWKRDYLDPALDYIRQHPLEHHTGSHCIDCLKYKTETCPFIYKDLLGVDLVKIDDATPEQSEEILDRYYEIKPLMDHIYRRMVQRMENGANVRNYELYWRENRVVSDDATEAALQALEGAGIDPGACIRVKPIADIDALTDGHTEEIIGPFLTRKQASPTARKTWKH